jgi:Zn-dependent M28 family amino/carboxypeptidase
VATGMEILSVISQREKPPKHPIIFLFNEAEESGLFGVEHFVKVLL